MWEVVIVWGAEARLKMRSRKWGYSPLVFVAVFLSGAKGGGGTSTIPRWKVRWRQDEAKDDHTCGRCSGSDTSNREHTGYLRFAPGAVSFGGGSVLWSNFTSMHGSLCCCRVSYPNGCKVPLDQIRPKPQECSMWRNEQFVQCHTAGRASSGDDRDWYTRSGIPRRPVSCFWRR